MLHLIGDVGGTNCRLALVRAQDGADVRAPETMLCRDHASLEALLQAYLARTGQADRVSACAIAVAGPVMDGAASLTNLGWSISEAGLRQLGLSCGVLLNDYEALALAAAEIEAGDVTDIGPPHEAARGGTVAVLGPGTGFGAAALVRDRLGAAVLVTEGGHIGFAPCDEVEVEVARRVAARYGRVSIERLLSGPGLVNLYEALGDIEGGGAACIAPEQVMDRATAGDDLACAAIERFCRILGAVAGDFALAYGATGGLLLAGGIAPRLLQTLNAGGFRAAFEDKGRFAAYVAAISTRVIVNPFFALKGAAARLRSS